MEEGINVHASSENMSIKILKVSMPSLTIHKQRPDGPIQLLLFKFFPYPRPFHLLKICNPCKEVIDKIRKKTSTLLTLHAHNECGFLILKSSFMFSVECHQFFQQSLSISPVYSHKVCPFCGSCKWILSCISFSNFTVCV